MIEGLPCKALHCEGGGRVGRGREGTDCGILDSVTSQWWSESEGGGQGEANKWNKRQQGGYSPQTHRHKPPALILHKYLSEKRVCVLFTHTPQGC